MARCLGDSKVTLEDFIPMTADEKEELEIEREAENVRKLKEMMISMAKKDKE